jgi:2-polyprenyl-3-methyl-5-hydroxy-6-metoxy-1,4-benzoquinol methylase
MKYLVNLFAFVLSRLLSVRKTRELIQKLIQLKTARTPNKEALILLLDLDTFLFKFTHGVAIQYNNGVHPCQRILNYKQFFIDQILATDVVLDIGCSFGQLSQAMAATTGARVIGLELLSERVDIARRDYAHAGLTYYHADALTFQPDEPITTIVLSAVLEHIEPRVQFLKTLVERYQPRQILIRVPMFTREYRVALRKELGLRYQMDSTHYIEYTLDEYMAEMAEARLSVSSYKVEWGELYAICIPVESHFETAVTAIGVASSVKS